MSGTIRIIGIDPGLHFTGWGIISVQGTRISHVANGTLRTVNTDTLSDRLLQLHTQLSSVIAEWAPDEAAVEETFVNKDARATLKLGQARGISLLVPASAGLAVAEYAPNVVKKAVVGAGHAHKDQISAMINILLPQCKPDSADAADALAVAITHAHHRKIDRMHSAAKLTV